MEITFGLISADSHIVLDRDAFRRNMSQSRWGDLIPEVRETDGRDGKKVDRWFVHGESAGGGGVVNCPAVMASTNTDLKVYPQRWDDVPAKVFDPLERLEALDDDGIDAEVLFPNDPARGQFFRWGAEFELACVQAHNDATAEWRAASDRFAPLLILPYLSPIETIVAEVQRGAKLGHRGITVLGEPGSVTRGGAKHFNDPFWHPLWETAQELEMPIHFHEAASIGLVSVPHWDGYTPNAFHTVMTSPTAAMVAQLIPNLVFSRLLERFPRLKWVCAESGLAWINYVCEGCDHEWEQRHLWTEGFTTRPSELVHRQVYMNFWYEKSGIELRHEIGVDHIMWESDYPHTTSTFPRSTEYVARALAGVPDDERRPMLYENAMRVYRLNESR